LPDLEAGSGCLIWMRKPFAGCGSVILDPGSGWWILPDGDSGSCCRMKIRDPAS